MKNALTHKTVAILRFIYFFLRSEHSTRQKEIISSLSSLWRGLQRKQFVRVDKVERQQGSSFLSLIKRIKCKYIKSRVLNWSAQIGPFKTTYQRLNVVSCHQKPEESCPNLNIFKETTEPMTESIKICTNCQRIFFTGHGKFNVARFRVLAFGGGIRSNGLLLPPRGKRGSFPNRKSPGEPLTFSLMTI